MGAVSLRRRNIRYLHVIDLPNLEEKVKKLYAALNNVATITQANMNEEMNKSFESIDTDTRFIINFAESFKYDNYNKSFVKKALPNISRDVSTIIALSETTTEELSIGQIPNINKLLKMENFIKKIKNVIESTKFTPYLVSLQTLKEDLYYMDASDVGILYENLEKASNISKFKGNNGQVIVEVSIKVEDQKYNIWKVINVPVINETNIFTLENNIKFLLSSANKLLGTSSDLSKLPFFDGVMTIENQYTNIDFLPLDNKSCLVAIFETRTNSLYSCVYQKTFENFEIFHHLGGYRYLFAIRDSVPYTFTCPGMDQNIEKMETIQGTGILSLNEGCTFKTKNSMLKAVKVDAIVEAKDKFQFSDIFNRIIFKLNSSVFKEPTKLKPLTKLYTNFDDFNESSKKIDQLQKQADNIMDRINNRPIPTRSSNWDWLRV